MVLLQPQRHLEEAAAPQAQTQAGVADAGGDGRVGRLFLTRQSGPLLFAVQGGQFFPFGIIWE
jgi:hypothetical protein